jgi:hypothetical protein
LIGNPFVTEPKVARSFRRQRIDDRIFADGLIVSSCHAGGEFAPEIYLRQFPFEPLLCDLTQINCRRCREVGGGSKFWFVKMPATTTVRGLTKRV